MRPTDAHHELQEFRASVGAQWTFLADPGRIVQKDLDIQEYTDPDHDPMIPHTIVLKPGLVVHSIYNGYWFWGRPSTDDLSARRYPGTRGRSATSASDTTSAPDCVLSAVAHCGPARARRGTLATSRTSTAGASGLR